MDVESLLVEQSLRIKEQEKMIEKLVERCDRYHWVLERNQVVLEALFDDYRKRNNISSKEGMEVMFG